MKKNLILFLTVFCQLLFYGKDKTTKSVYIDSSVSELSLSEPNKSTEQFHLFSHGRSGELYIDKQWMTADKIAEKFRAELNGKKELYIYGCNFAQGEKGLQAVSYLEKHLNISVSASNNVTGIDGDWILEVGHGKHALSQNGYAFNLQLDNIHYLNPVISGSYSAVNGLNAEFIYLSTPSTTPITVNVRFGNNTDIPRLRIRNLTTGIFTNTAFGTVTLDNENPVGIQFWQNGTGIQTIGTTALTRPIAQAGSLLNATNSGLVLTSTSNFYVNYRVNSQDQAGSLMAKGKNALGREFRWGGTPIEFGSTIDEIGNMLSIMATEDNTVINISEMTDGTFFRVGSNPSGIIIGPTFPRVQTITRTLSKGQSFILYAEVRVSARSSQDDGWLGAKITSNKDVAVTVGGLMQQGDGGDARDIGFDQLVPVSEIGFDYILMRGNGGAREKGVVVATENATQIFLNGSIIPTATLALAGDYYLIPNSSFNTEANLYVRTSKRAYVFHKIYGNTGSNTNNLMFIPPLSCFGQTSVDLIPDARQIGGTTYNLTQLVVLVKKTLPAPVVTIYSGPTRVATILPTPTIGNVTGNTVWGSYRFPLTIDGDVKVTSTGNIQAQLFGGSGNAGYGGYFSGFGEAPNVTITSSDTPDVCAGRTTLSTTSIGTYQWYKDGVVISGATSSSYTLNPITDAATASYFVIVTTAGDCAVPSNILTSTLCVCTKPGATGTPDSYTDVGISVRDKRTTANWPKDIPNGFLALESNTKGFVLTRMASPETSIADPVDGMLVYDTDEPCIKLYNGTTWKCIQQNCN